MRSALISPLPLLVLAAAHAAEVVIEEKPFTVKAAFDARVMPPDELAPLRMDTEVWQDFRVETIAAHGTVVEKGALLVAFDSTAIDRSLADTGQSFASTSLDAARMERELKTLEETAPHRLEALRRAADIAKEENDYFTKTRRKAAEDAAAQQLERKKQALEGQQEELRQLEKMYQADNLTEETEEIILTRQKNDVAAAEFALRMETLDYHRKIEVTLPREAVTLAERERDAAIALRDAKEEIPRAVEAKKLELAALAIRLERKKTAVADLEHDRALFEIKAPAAGMFYHGPIADGRWSPGDIVKQLTVGGRIPAKTPFATFVPATVQPMLVAFTDEATARSLKAGLPGIATLPGRAELDIPVKLVRIAPAPEPDGTWRVDLTATWPAESTPPVGATANIHITAYHQERAIFIPTKALTRDAAKGWSVEVKLTDGKAERRPVKRGRTSGDNTEILSGLEIGQVILAP
jgi:hypothetical protein